MRRLTSLQAYRVGYLRAKRQARRELRGMAQRWDDELASLEDEFNSVAKELQAFEQVIGITIASARDPDATVH